MTRKQLRALRGHKLSLAFCNEKKNVISSHVGASLSSNDDILRIDPGADISFLYRGPGEFVRVWVCIDGVPKSPIDDVKPTYICEGDVINLVVKRTTGDRWMPPKEDRDDQGTM